MERGNEQGLDLNPHPERVTDAYADERIREKIDLYSSDRPRAGLSNVSEYLKRDGWPAAYRLHYITAVAHLGRVSAETLPRRVERPGEKMRR